MKLPRNRIEREPTYEHGYIALLEKLLRVVQSRPTRTGVDALALPFESLEHNQRAMGLPMLKTKKMSFNIVKTELEWMLNGMTNVRWLQERGVHIWDEWADSNGALGPIYGKQWRDFNGVDQIAELLEGLWQDPYGRRHVVSAWNPAELQDMALPPCHYSFQVVLSTCGKYLDLVFTMRSTDVFLGLPYNMAFYGLLAEVLASWCGRQVGTIRWQGGDVHLYVNHVQQAIEQIKRYEEWQSIKRKKDREHIVGYGYDPRTIVSFDYSGRPEFDLSSFMLFGYDPYPVLPAEVAV